MFDLSSRLAVVTGSAQGMGRAMALAEAGADLVLLDRNEPGIQATAHAITQLGRKALPIAGDVTNTDHLDQVFATIDRTLGRVDILGNVAGEAKSGPAEDMALADIQTTFHNLVISHAPDVSPHRGRMAKVIAVSPGPMAACRAVPSRARQRVRPRQSLIPRNQLGTQLSPQPKITGVVRGQSGGDR